MIIMSDFIVQTVIQEALEEIANNSAIFDALFVEFKKAHFSSTYGQKEIDSIKSFFMKKQIKVVTSWSQVQSKYPCYSVQLSASGEIDAESSLGDYLYDQYSNEGEVVNVLGNGNDYPQQTPTYDEKNEVYGAPIQESVLIGCHGVDKPNVARYMAWVLHYILRSKMQTFIERGIDRISLQFTDFNGANEYLPEQVFTRFCTFRGVHYLTFNKKIDPFSLTSVNTKVKAQVQDTEFVDGTTDQGDEDDTVITID